MTISSTWSTRILLGTMLTGMAAVCCGAQQQPSQPVPITNDTPAATSKAMPPETTPTTSGAPLTKDQMKAQRKQQKAEEKAAGSNAKAAKSTAKAKKQSDKAVQDREKATQATPPSQ